MKTEMTYTYELIVDELGEVVKRTDENGVVSWIPTPSGASVITLRNDPVLLDALLDPDYNRYILTRK